MSLTDFPPEVDAALNACFQAAVEPDLWPEAMDLLAQALGQAGCGFHPRGVQARLNVPASSAYCDMLKDFLAEGWVDHDPRARGWRLVASGAVMVTDDDVATSEERARSPFYREFLEPRDMHVFLGLGFRVDGQDWSLSCGSNRNLQEQDLSYLAQLQPQLAHVVRFADAMSRRVNAGALSALDATGRAAMLIDWRGRVAAVNEHARALLGDRLDVRAGHLVVHDPLGHAAMQRLIAAAHTPGFAGTGRSIVVVRRPEGLPIVAEALPARGALADSLGLSGVLLLFTDLENASPQDGALLRPAFGLTGREAAVAVRLAAGDTPAQIATDLTLKMSSVRQLIKSSMAKANVSTRAELVALIKRLPG